MKVLVIEDNPRLSERMRRQLQKWYIVEVAHSGFEGIQFVARNTCDIVLLDLGLPDLSGLEICQHIRKLAPNIPILIVTGVDTVQSRVELLNAGADDYITKPFSSDELIARINALTRRLARSDNQQLLTVGDLTLQTGRREVTRAGKTITLRRKEFDILEYLIRNQGRVMSRPMIISHAWPAVNDAAVGSVDVHIKQLRDKIDKPFSYPLIKTLYGSGYMIDVPENSTSQPGESDA